jgi:hypothetical protein
MPNAHIVSIQPIQMTEVEHRFDVVVSIDGEQTVIVVSAEDLNDPFAFHTCVLERTGKLVEFEIDDIDQTQQWHDLLAIVPWLEIQVDRPKRKPKSTKRK